MNVELVSMLWGGLSGAAVFALGLYWLWDMKPSNAETEWLRSEVKDLRVEVNDGQRRLKFMEALIHDLEHPPFKPKFGDWVMAEKEDESGMQAAVYIGSHGGVHRVIRKTGDSAFEFDAKKVEPLDD